MVLLVSPLSPMWSSSSSSVKRGLCVLSRPVSAVLTECCVFGLPHSQGGTLGQVDKSSRCPQKHKLTQTQSAGSHKHKAFINIRPGPGQVDAVSPLKPSTFRWDRPTDTDVPLCQHMVIFSLPCDAFCICLAQFGLWSVTGTDKWGFEF